MTAIRSRFLWSAFAVCAASAVAPNRAFAFAEDICFQTGGKPTNCLPVPSECLPIGTTSVACRVAAARLVADGSRAAGVRSSVHADATQLLAQAVGFSAEDAYWIAAYNEVTDYGTFEATDETGAPYGGGTFKTASLDGFVRTNTTSGGLLFHFGAPYSGGASTPPLGIDGLHPDAADGQTEILLAHLRAWAMGATGDARVLCTAGLTTMSGSGDFATGTSCFVRPDGSAVPVTGVLSSFGSTSIHFNLETGAQPIAGSSTAVQLDALVGGGASRSSDARIGIYLHSLADRVSHHACLDGSVISGPTGAGWNEDMTAAQCSTGYHMLYHAWETGVDFTRVPSNNRTTEAALDIVYDELVAFATARGVARAGASDPARKTSILGPLVAALQTEDADARIQAIADLACQDGFVPFPGMPACAGGNGSGNGSDGAGARSGCSIGGSADWQSPVVALLLACAVGGIRRRPDVVPDSE